MAVSPFLAIQWLWWLDCYSWAELSKKHQEWPWETGPGSEPPACFCLDGSLLVFLQYILTLLDCVFLQNTNSWRVLASRRG